MKKTLSILLMVLGTQAFAIIYRHDVPEERYRQLAMQTQFNCVGEVFDCHNGMQEAGSCVLVGDRYVLSAAHVFKQSISGDKMDTMFLSNKGLISAAAAAKYSRAERDTMKRIILYKHENEKIGDAANYQFRFNRRMYRGKTIKILPEYMDKATRGRYDIALIELEVPVKNTVPAAMNKLTDESGTEATIVGFGTSGNAADPEDVGLYYTKLAGENMVDSIYGEPYKGNATLLGFDFDKPGAAQYNLSGSTQPLALEGLCGGGDSGGGMFRKTKNGWELIGICSGSGTNIELLMKIGYYGNTGSYTRVSAFYYWIRSAIDQMEKTNTNSAKK